MTNDRPCTRLLALLPSGHGEHQLIVDGLTIAAVRLRDLTIGIDTELEEIRCSSGSGPGRTIVLTVGARDPDAAARLQGFFDTRFSPGEEREV